MPLAPLAVTQQSAEAPRINGTRYCAGSIIGNRSDVTGDLMTRVRIYTWVGVIYRVVPRFPHHHPLEKLSAASNTHTHTYTRTHTLTRSS